MKNPQMTSGLVFALLASLTFGTSGVLIKPLLEAGWSPVAAVTVRALSAGLILLPVAILSLRGRWSALWRARWRVLAMGVIGVAATQVLYFAALARIPVSTALLIEFLAPVLLVAVAWAVSRRMPKPVVIAGSVFAIGGLLLVIGPGALQAVDPIGLAFAFAASVGCAVYFVVAARPSDGLPAVALAGFGLLLGGVLLAVLALAGALPFTVEFGDLAMFGGTAAWWVPLIFVAAISTAFPYAAGITAAGKLGSRVASFVGLLEVVFATIFAWMLLGEQIGLLQLLGGLLILGGIAAVRAEKVAPEPTITDVAVQPANAAR
jgi:drug/metabolite transporter (DMT)-like permease